MSPEEIRLKALELALDQGHRGEEAARFARVYADYISGNSDAAIRKRYSELTEALAKVPGFIGCHPFSSSAVANFLNPAKAPASSQPCRKKHSGKGKSHA